MSLIPLQRRKDEKSGEKRKFQGIRVEEKEELSLKMLICSSIIIIIVQSICSSIIIIIVQSICSSIIIIIVQSICSSSDQEEILRETILAFLVFKIYPRKYIQKFISMQIPKISQNQPKQKSCTWW